MNKKKLSVVMAGAMLASSVAPVLAAEEVSVTEVQKGTLINELTDKIWDAPVFSTDSRVDSTLVGKSVYGLKIGDATVEYITVDKDGMVKSDLQKALQTKINALTVGTSIKLVNLGYRTLEVNGKTLVLSTEETSTYTEAELANSDGLKAELDTLVNGKPQAYNSIIASHGYKASEGYVINLKVDLDGDSENDKIVLKAGSSRLDFTHFIEKTTGQITEIKSGIGDISAKFNGFKVEGNTNTDIADKVEAEYKIASDGTTLALSDIFDGVMLTEKGQALLNEAKATKYVLTSKEVSDPKEDYIVKVNGNNDTAKGIATAKADKNGVYTIKVQIADANKVSEAVGSTKTWTPKATQYNTYYITGTSKAELTKVLNWIDELSADVDVLAGSNRYETAVKIAKEVASLNKVNDNGNIVLVNGDSLVDGLSAAPLAASKSNAPILLTESDKLPTATKKYLSELVDKAENKTVTVNIVGGKSVVSTSVERELRALGLKVDRFGGDNREETSMAVAEEVANGDITKAFVVGAEGEADAMSIAGYAADTTTPIVVAKKGGITEDTVEALDGATLNVIGGENAVSAADYASLKDVALTIARVSGSNRKATNAAVINKFYGGNFADADSVIVAKDGQNKKSELIDALAASNLASVQHAPVVLGTNNLSADQIDAIAKNAKSADKVYQVGYGVERNVVKLVAQSLGLI
ncbi:cell wall-binding repeat-containing protein [Peptacetobacter hiranonis]|uniref:cell wall-binding repeat-containing protein n=1 Tax=Peptacetobacter hiranonis TaxID=89152 RepID=UPI00191733E6|nr:cell wall-binding repeat-containing protein [Peptacetobacter hiranonis]QQQ86130.1 cell wall-binding repeat-containing protein [Peptacetobacter hiranonis]